MGPSLKRRGVYRARLARVRKDSGVGILLMGSVIALVIIPMIGLFVFELNRYQFAQQTLSKACDAAALAGGAKLISAEVDLTDPLAATPEGRRRMKQSQAYSAAVEFMKQQRVLGVDLSNADNLDVLPKDSNGPLNASGLQANKCRIYVHIVDPGTNYGPVPLGSENGRAIKVEAVFTEIPTFVRHLGITQVPVFANAASGAPRLDVILCLDLSGSMDDSTRVTFVRKVVELDSNGQSLLADAGPPPPVPDVEGQCGGRPDPCNADDPNDPSYDACREFLACVDQKCADFNNQYDIWESKFNDATKQDRKYINYRQASRGQLRACVESQMTVPPTGTQINGLPHRHLSYLKTPFVTQNASLLYQGQITTGDPCGGGAGFTDLVVNLDSRILTPMVQQPILDNNAFQPAGPYNQLASLVERQRGSNNAAEAWGQYAKRTGEVLGVVTFGGPTAKEEYENDAKRYLQPAATVIEAAKAFIEALADSGRSIRLGLVGYEEVVPAEPDQQDDPNTPEFENARRELVKSDDPSEQDRFVPVIGLVSLSQAANVSSLKAELDKMYSLRKTDITNALDRARQLLNPTNQTSTRAVKKIIVLFTDGQNTNETSPVPVAQQCKSQRTAIYSIGLAQSPDLFPLMQALLTDKNPGGVSFEAGNGGVFLSAPSAAQVRSTFLKLAARLVKLQQ